MKLRSLMFAFALTTMSAPAFAEDFTFIVPVDVQNLAPEINRMTVSCSVGVLPGTPGVRARLIGAGRADIPISGSYRGDVTITFNASLAGDAGYANSYTCSIPTFSAITPGGISGRAYHMGTPPPFPLSPGAPLRLSTGEVRLP
jgi:hypothetical protein